MSYNPKISDFGLFQVDSNLELETWNLEPETWNLKPNPFDIFCIAKKMEQRAQNQIYLSYAKSRHLKTEGQCKVQKRAD